MDLPVLLYRTEAGDAVAMEDRCPHRHVPLSLGRLDGDVIECGYHGLRFGPSGACIRIPGQEIIPGPLKDKFAATWKQRVAEQAAGKRTGDPIQGCLPPGMPRFMTGTNGPSLIIQTPGRVMLYRDGDPVRRVWPDGRAQPKPADLEGFSNGNAIGHYEGQDLVTDLVGFKDYPIDSTGIPHSDDLHTQERFHRVDADTLKVMVTLTDKTAYTKPMTTIVTYKTLGNPLWEPKEFICKPKTDFYPEVYVH